MKNVPSIGEGIYLERCKTLLPWLSKPRNIRDLPKVICEMGDNNQYLFHWKNEKIFGGLKSDLWVELYENQALREVNPAIQMKWREQDEKYHMRLANHLTAYLGDPTTISEVSESDIPSFYWTIEKVKISLYRFDRFGEHTVFNISLG